MQGPNGAWNSRPAIRRPPPQGFHGGGSPAFAYGPFTNNPFGAMGPLGAGRPGLYPKRCPGW
jgi:hypothetical protein